MSSTVVRLFQLPASMMHVRRHTPAVPAVREKESLGV